MRRYIKKLDWRGWLLALLQTTIGGAASSGAAYLGMNTAADAGFNVPKLNLESLGVLLAASTLGHLFFYLRQSPVPKEIVEEYDNGHGPLAPEPPPKP